jgi:NAD(P)-dependent dehydrogenase (short-subunit alcohol dehydrogenase family)
MTGGPIALVTGASRGIGRAAARALAFAGWHVVAAARSQKALEALDDEVRADGRGALTIAPLDLKDHDGVDRLGHALYERWGRIDGLVHAAGVLGELTPIFQAKPAMVAEAFSVNALSTYRIIRSIDPLLRRAPSGRAVFITSSRARKTVAYWGVYAATKAAQEQLALTYAAEVAMTAIRVCVVDPGPMRTAMRAKAMPGEDPETLAPPEALAPLLLALLDPTSTRHGEVIRFRDEAQAPPSPA